MIIFFKIVRIMFLWMEGWVFCFVSDFSCNSGNCVKYVGINWDFLEYS